MCLFHFVSIDFISLVAPSGEAAETNDNAEGEENDHEEEEGNDHEEEEENYQEEDEEEKYHKEQKAALPSWPTWGDMTTMMAESGMDTETGPTFKHMFCFQTLVLFFTTGFVV